MDEETTFIGAIDQGTSSSRFLVYFTNKNLFKKKRISIIIGIILE